MSIVKTVLSNMLEEEPFLLVAVRSILFLMFFLISVYLETCFSFALPQEEWSCMPFS